MDQNYENGMNQEPKEKAQKPEETRREPYREYHFRDQGYYGGQPSYPPYQPRPRKEHPILKDIGVFTAKAAIASLLAALALGGTTVAVTKATGLDQAIERLGEEPEQSGFPDFGDFRGFGGGRGNDDAENGGDDEQTPPREEKEPDENDGPKLGVSVTTVTDDMIEQGYPAGVMIAQVADDSDADKAGLKEGDIITAFNGTVVKTNSDLAELVHSSKAGKSVKVVYKRLDHGEYKAMETTVTFSEAEANN